MVWIGERGEEVGALLLLNPLDFHLIEMPMPLRPPTVIIPDWVLDVALRSWRKSISVGKNCLKERYVSDYRGE